MDLPVHNARGVALNTSSQDELSDTGLGPERARRILANRPYRSWDDVKRVEGFTDVVVDALQRAGAELGDPTRAEVVPLEEERDLKPEERDVEIRGKRL
jgi:Helix-hairpin-helix motif